MLKFSKIVLAIASVISVSLDAKLLYAQTDYFPLHVGNQWTYHYHFEDFSRNSIDSIFTFSVTDSLSESHLFDRYFLYSGNLNWVDSSLFMVEDEKVIRFLNGKNLLWYDFSANAGDSWTIPVREHRYPPYDSVDVIAEVKSKTDTFVLGTDTLRECYRFRFHFTKSIPDVGPWEELFAPNLGFVEGETVPLGTQSTRLIGAFIAGQPVSVSPKGDSHNFVLQDFSVKQNYPNPFNGTTRIGYEIEAASTTRVSVKIYSLLGQEIRTLVAEDKRSGGYQITWDGKDRFGREVASGIYLARIQAGQAVQLKKMTLLK